MTGLISGKSSIYNTNLVCGERLNCAEKKSCLKACYKNVDTSQPELVDVLRIVETHKPVFTLCMCKQDITSERSRKTSSIADVHDRHNSCSIHCEVDDGFTEKNLPLLNDACNCRLQRRFQCNVFSYTAFVLGNSIRTPNYTYHPVRRKYEDFIKVLQKPLYVFAHLSFGFGQKNCIATFLRTLFVFTLLVSLLLQSVSAQLGQQNCTKSSQKKCPSLQSIWINRTFQQTENFSVSYTDSTFFCEKLLSCRTACVNSRHHDKIPEGTYQFATSGLETSSMDEWCVNRTLASVCNQLRYNLFCDHIPTLSLLSYDPLFSESQEASCKCVEEIDKIEQADVKAKNDYYLFVDTMIRFATPLDYSMKWNYTQCLVNYKKWICAQHHTVYRYNSSCERMSYPWCPSVCLQTESSCPFFRIFNQTKLRGGQPTFICEGFFDTKPSPTLAAQDCYVSPIKLEADFRHLFGNYTYPSLDDICAKRSHPTLGCAAGSHTQGLSVLFASTKYLYFILSPFLFTLCC